MYPNAWPDAESTERLEVLHWIDNAAGYGEHPDGAVTVRAGVATPLGHGLLGVNRSGQLRDPESKFSPVMFTVTGPHEIGSRGREPSLVSEPAPLRKVTT